MDAPAVDLSSDQLNTGLEDAEFVVYRRAGGAQATTPARSVLVVMPRSEHPRLQAVRMLEHEHSLRDDLDPAWALRPLALTTLEGRTALVLEDPGGELLAHRTGTPMDVGDVLRVGAGVAAALRQLHGRGLIHKDLKPANVMTDGRTGRAWLRGFGITSRLPRERRLPEPPEVITGTLAYMAPEQTGWMNRSLDGRGDLYALGVILYELSVGRLPFTASDAMAWVHAHVAQRPVPPAERRRDVPEMVSAIVMKLLAKAAEDRYQTASAVERDLRRCLAQWEADGRIDAFPLAERDTPDRLIIPETLYGRAREIEALLAAFGRVVTRGTPELVLLSGNSGVGKSSVANELHSVLVPPRGLFASGKFDQHKRDIPYATLAQALQSIVQGLLGRSETELSDWRDALADALGPNASLMIDMVPELKVIIGNQPPVPELAPQDARRRFQLVFRRFIGVFARPDHPLTLFLDDLQWLDAATFDLLEDLLAPPGVPHLLLIGAYRDNEVTAAHPLPGKVAAIRSAGANVHEVTLAPLAAEDVGLLVANALRCDVGSAAPLTRVVHEKTGGNPFFVNRFMASLAEEGLLAFDYDAARWSWDLGRIQTKGYTDNLVEIMAGKLTRLTAETQRAVQQLACLGSAAPIATLSLVFGMTETEIHSLLEEAVRADLLERRRDSYHFVHDRIQEAAYLLVPESLRTEAHLRIGRLFAVNTPPEQRDEVIYEIVNQLNRGAPLITSVAEREELAELNRIAGKRAKASTAYGAALSYLVMGDELLARDCWQRRYPLMFALQAARAECEVLTGDLVAAEERLSTLSFRAANLVDKAAVACLRTALYTTLGRADRAVEICVEYLREAGIACSLRPTDVEVSAEYERLLGQLGDRSIEALFDVPLMSDPGWRATMEVLTELSAPAYFLDVNLWCLVLLRMANLSAEHGNCDGSCYAYGFMNTVVGARFGNYRAGFLFGQLSLDLLEKKGLGRFKARAYFGCGCAVFPWAQHVRASVPLLRRGLDTALETGDQTYAAYAYANLIPIYLTCADALEEVQREAESALELGQRAGFGLAVDMVTGQLAFIRTVRGMTPEFGSFCDDGFNEGRYERHLQNSPSFVACWYWLRKLQARLYAGDYASAVSAAEKARQLLQATTGLFAEADYHFYGALARAAASDSATTDNRQEHAGALAEHHRRLALWAENCPENFAHRAALVGAELARLDNRELEAERLYDQAIRAAREQRFLQDEGLAYELAARFHRARGFEAFSDLYLRRARHCYQQWGGHGKARQLIELYPRLRDDEPAPNARDTIGAPVEQLELATVLKVSEAVSSEIVFDKLVLTVLHTAIEQAGAERGVLIVPQGHELRIRAEARTDDGTMTAVLRDSAISSTDLPESVVRYAARARERVSLDGRAAQSRFSNDEYLRREQTRSVLCLPLMQQGQLMGLLYLENNLAASVFTPARMAVLNVLASQAAMSLEKARLYQELQQREAKIRRLVEANIIAIIISDLDGRITDANDAFLRMLQYDRDDLVSGRVRWTELTPPEWRDRDERGLAEIEATGAMQPYEKEYFRKDGSRVPVLIGGALFQDGSYGGVGFALDLSDQKRAEAEIRALKDQLYNENLVLRDEVDRTSMFEEIVGASQALQPVLARVAKVARSDTTVLIMGETGTGKELVARAVHRRSPRGARPFVSVNCAAVPRELIASELFGHEKGAFTGATQRRLGRFELAHGGTIFLDEVGELSIEIQVALLRVLQEREFERVGGSTSIRIDVRVIAATNRDLRAAIEGGTFRQDLFYRLNVFPITAPPLRERADDIPLLVEYFIDRYARKAGKTIRRVNKRTLDSLQSYPWPGNVRELQNVIERSVIVCDTDEFIVDESWLSTAPAVESPHALSSTLAGHEKAIVEEALRASGGRVFGPSGAAARLGLARSTLESKIRTLGINKNRFRGRSAKP